jgi:hypothetical protein
VNQRHYFLTTEEFFNKIGQKRSFRPDPPNVRFAPIAVIPSDPSVVSKAEL